MHASLKVSKGFKKVLKISKGIIKVFSVSTRSLKVFNELIKVSKKIIIINNYQRFFWVLKATKSLIKVSKILSNSL